VSFYVSTATFFLLHCHEWDRVVALPRHILQADVKIPIVTTRPFSLPCYLQGSENGRLVTIGKHSRLNRQIWYRHPNSEAGNDEIQKFREKIFILWELHSKILVGDKNLL
jgi:hypothetical protein